MNARDWWVMGADGHPLPIRLIIHPSPSPITHHQPPIHRHRPPLSLIHPNHPTPVSIHPSHPPSIPVIHSSPSLIHPSPSSVCPHHSAAPVIPVIHPSIHIIHSSPSSIPIIHPMLLSPPSICAIIRHALSLHLHHPCYLITWMHDLYGWVMGMASGWMIGMEG